MEQAILEESEHPEQAAIGEAAHETETLLDGPAWEQVEVEVEEEAPAPAPAATLGRVRVESAGRASVAPDGSVRVELVLRDESGRRSSATLSFRIDPQAEEPQG
jgi:hypothetical protein